MAWQLIYTSAPRSLEAGRSGFGTVARHRAISPLLVSAIERVSQFSRLPGADTGRVIFCYRIIAVAGGRFHVLSSIRDAGADYTGRTNHIAHHLIADPREIAQLGTNGPSPADVLLAMHWATSWTEQPRFFEATDEVALARFGRHSVGSAWQRITGRPEQAWLLASGDASRGAYIIQPAEVDLRAVFAESLRLIPERLWQISFTTSLQPSDEPADFRWIGIEERSPLRAQTETSGRTVLDLAAPHKLPLVEVVQPDIAAQIQQSFASISAPSSSEVQTTRPDTTSVAPLQRPGWTPNERAVEMPSTSATSKRGHRNLWLVAGTLAILVMIGAAYFVGHPIYVKHEHRKAVCAEIDSILNRSGFFSDQVSKDLKGAEAIDVAKELAKAADRSWQVAHDADFTAMLSPPNKALSERARSANLNTPVEINALDDRLEKLAAVYQWLRDFRPKPEDYQAIDEIEKRRREADQLTSPTPKTNTFAKIKGVIGTLADTRRAQTVNTLLSGASEGRVQPAQSPAWFDHALSATTFASDDDETKLIIKASRRLIDDWKFTEAQELNKVLTDLEQRVAQRPDWPSWLKAKAEAKITAARKGKPAVQAMSASRVASSLPAEKEPKPEANSPLLHFVADNNVMSIELPSGPLRFFVRQEGRSDEELRAYGNDPKLGLGDGGRRFKVPNGKLEPGSQPPTPPYELSVRSQESVELLHIYVGSANSVQPLIAGQSIGLKRDGHLLKITGSFPRIAQVTEPSFVLITPTDFDGSGQAQKLPVTVAGECELEPVLTNLSKRIAAKRAEAERLSKQAARQGAEATSVDAIRAKAKEYVKLLKKEDAKKAFNPEAKTGAELVGDFAKALAAEWTEMKDNSFEDLRKAGGALGDAFAKPAEAQAKNKELLSEVQKLEQKHRSPQKVDGLSKLRGLCNNLAASFGDTVAVEKEITRFRNAAETAEREAKALEQMPLFTSQSPPPGEYALIAKLKNMNEVKLYTFTVK